jgi:hypothetical protein
MGKDIKDLGEEEIRAKMELAKISITAAVGLLLTSLLGWAFIAINNLGNTLFILGILTVFIALWAGLFIAWIIPNNKRFLELAKELDRRKKKG